jgi:hypothetical protein
LRFLGLEYNGATNKLKARTKKGAELEFDKWDLAAAVAATEKGNKQYIKKQGIPWKDLFQSKIFGYIQARLYAGNYSLENIEQDFKLRPSPGSWTEMYPSYGMINSTERLRRRLTKVRDGRHALSTEERQTIFNSSSLANAWLAGRLRAARKANPSELELRYRHKARHQKTVGLEYR